jgi:arylsulfatase A-like enzyme
MNGVLLLFDRLPTRVLSCYGNLRAATPAFGRLAASSVVFDQHIADAPLSRHIVASFGIHGVRVLDATNESAPSASIAGQVAAAARELCAAPGPWLIHARCTGVADAGAETPQPGESIEEIDNALGNLLQALTPIDEVLLLVAGLSGSDSPRPDVPEALRPLMSERIQTPLFIRLPERRWGTRRQSLAATSDLVPTLAEWFALPATCATDAVSLLPVVRDDVRSVRDRVVIRNENAGAVRTPEWLLLAPRAAETSSAHAADSALLFRKPEDAWDVLNVSPQHPEVTNELLQLLQGSVSRESS